MSNLINSTNIQYHSNRTALSSSMLKMLLKNPEEFYDVWFNGNQKTDNKEAFIEGSFVHTLILEPEKVFTDYAVFTGMRRQGAVWDAFKADNQGKTIVTAPQVSRSEALVKAYSSTPLAVELITGGFSEHTCTSQILGIPVKTRADYINIEKGYIVDVKTTSMPSDKDIFKLTVEEYMYQLSAALYCQVAFDTYGKLFEFYWLVLSKDDKQCRVYRASSRTLSEGSALTMQAIVKYKHCLKTGNWRNSIRGHTFVSEGSYEIEEI